MASVVRENVGLLTDKLTVQLSKEDYLPAFEQSIKKYAKTANIPGFRKGMVPTGMIKKMYGASVFSDEVLKTVEKELNTYMQAENLDIFAQPLPLYNNLDQLDSNNPAEYNFDFEIGLKPALDLNIGAIQVVRNKVDVTQAMIDEEVDKLKVRHGKMTEPEVVESDENVLNLEFKETDAEGNTIEDGINKGNSLLVRYFSERVRPQLIGKKKDESIVVQLSEAFDEKEREWIVGDLGLDKDDTTAAQKYFRLNITKIGLVEKPEMDSTFFEAAFPGRNIANEDDFYAAVKAGIQAQWDVQSRNQLHDQIYHQLIDHNEVEFPDNFLKRWIQMGGEEKKTAEEAEAEYPKFKSSLKWTLISTQLMDQYEVKVEPDEIKDFARQQILGYMGLQDASEAPWIESYAENMLKDKKFIENTYYQLQTTKLFNALEPQVNVTEKLVSPEELAGMQHHHEH